VGKTVVSASWGVKLATTVRCVSCARRQSAAFDCLRHPNPYTPRVIRNVIFDWSGTLVDDLPAVWQATNHVLARAGRPKMTLEQFRAEFCLPFTIFYNKHIPHVPLPQLEEWFHSRFRRAQGSVVELPHAREFLAFCRARRLRTFVLSTVHRDHFTKQSSKTGFGKFIDAPYIGVWDKRRKIHEILKKHRLKRDETLFIGDMQHDIETARLGGVHSCAVLTGYNTLTQLRAAKPDVIVEHLRELREILEAQGLELQPVTRAFEDLHPPVVTVGALVFNDAGKVLLVRTHKWSNLWGIPGGKVRYSETCEHALRRELEEETHLRVNDIAFVLVQDCIHSKEFYRDAHFVLLNYTCRAPGRQTVRLNDEAREFRWVTLAEARTMPVNQPTRRLLEAVTGKPTETSPARRVAAGRRSSPKYA